MRRARAITILAASGLLLAACAGVPSTSTHDGRLADPTAESQRVPTATEPTVAVDDAGATVTTADATWRIDLLEAGAVDLGDLEMFDGASVAEPPPAGSQVGWVCVAATQLAGEAGAWMSDDVRIEVWDGVGGPRFDDLTGFDYEPADGSLDVYEASGNALGEPYERVCPIFVVPGDVDFSTVAIVPNGGEPAVLER